MARPKGSKNKEEDLDYSINYNEILADRFPGSLQELVTAYKNNTTVPITRLPMKNNHDPDLVLLKRRPKWNSRPNRTKA
jgi:hypothetical protein